MSKNIQPNLKEIIAERLSAESQLFDDCDIEYAIPFDWGSLQVTSQAHEAYGMELLVPSIKPEQLSKHDSPTLKGPLHFMLVAPDESQLEIDPSYIALQPLPNTVQSKKSMSVVLNLNEDKQGLVEDMRGVVADAIRHKISQEGLELDEIANDEILKRSIDFDTNMSLDEAITYNAPQELARRLALVAGVSALAIGHTQLNEAHNKSLLRNLSVRGLGVVVSNAVLLSPIVVSESSPSLGTASAAIAVNTAVHLNMGYSALRNWLRNAGDRDKQIADTTSKIQIMVSDDIFSVYSRDHFDQQLEELLRDLD